MTFPGETSPGGGDSKPLAHGAGILTPGASRPRARDGVDRAREHIPQTVTMTETEQAREPKPRSRQWTPLTVSIVVAVIGAVATCGTASSSAFVSKMSKDRDIEVEKAKLELEKERDARKVENEYFQKATDPALSPEQRQRVFRFLQIALRGRPLQEWATSELELAKGDIKAEQEEQQRLAELRKRLNEASAKTTSQETRLRTLESELAWSKKIAASRGRRECMANCLKAFIRGAVGSSESTAELAELEVHQCGKLCESRKDP